MTDSCFLDSLRSEAVQLLLDEVFTHINATMHERYTALGKENSRLTNNREIRFIHKGVIYPPAYVLTVPYGSQIPVLHYSLLGELDIINRELAQADYGYIKNFFIAAISNSHNAIVLDQLLPAVLINVLKLHFNTPKFKALDNGVFGALQQEPLSVTKQNIQDIKKHYHATITTLQHLLMDKLLLQS